MRAGGSDEKKEQPPDESPRGRWSSLIPDTVLTAFVVSLAVGGSYFIYQAEYVGGLRGAGVGQSFLLAPALKPLIVFITAAIVVPMVVVRFLDRRLTLGHKLVRLVFPAVCLAAIFIPIKAAGPGAAIYLRGFERRMLEKVDIEAIQQWLATEGEKHTGRVYRNSFPSELPVCLTEFRPDEILFSDAASEQGMTIEFRWHAPRGENYGLVVGPSSMDAPEEDTISLPDGAFNEFRRPIKPGAYVFARG